MRPSAFNPFANCTGQPRCLLQAHRVELDAEQPVPDGWHEVDPGRYQHYWSLCAAQD